jgi:hypothetical protein
MQFSSYMALHTWLPLYPVHRSGLRCRFTREGHCQQALDRYLNMPHYHGESSYRHAECTEEGGRIK